MMPQGGEQRSIWLNWRLSQDGVESNSQRRSLMSKALGLTRAVLLAFFLVGVAACAAPATPPQTQSTNAPAAGQSATPSAGSGQGAAPAAADLPTTAPAAGAPTAAAAQPAASGNLTDVGTPRSETLIVQTFDGKTDNPDNMNPLSGSYAIWRGFRELAWGYLWEMDTATGKSYPELAADLPKVLVPRLPSLSRGCRRLSTPAA
jgi:hypothetical protein